jgi:hypothetical protein
MKAGKNQSREVGDYFPIPLRHSRGMECPASIEYSGFLPDLAGVLRLEARVLAAERTFVRGSAIAVP